MDKFLTGLGKFVAITGLIVVIGVLIALPVMWLWNYLCPELFNLPKIGFWQAWGLYILCSTLFKSSSSSSTSK